MRCLPTSVPAVWVVAVVVLATAAAGAAEPPAARHDPLASAVLESLAFPPRTTAPGLLDAAIRAADVEAYDVASRYVSQLADQLEQAGDRRLDLLADLGDTTDPASLRRLERVLGDRDADVRPLVRAITTATRQRRGDPDRLRRDANALADASATARAAAFDRLSRAGVAALPVLVDLLQTEDAAHGQARALARRIVRSLGSAARQPLLAWLGSDDVEHWPGVMEALAAGVTTATDGEAVAPYLLAPALVADAPPAVRAGATRLLRQLGDRGLLPPLLQADGAVPPAPETARTWLTTRLDRVLSVAGLPAPDHLLREPVNDPATAVAAADGTVERFVWNPQTRHLERRDVSPRAARSEDAIHLARDLAALDATDPAAVRLVLLSRLDATLVAAGDPLDAGDGLPIEPLQAALTGPAGFDAAAAADVVDLAGSRGMFTAAVAAIRAGAAAHAAGRGTDPAPEAADASAERVIPAPLPPAVRLAWQRALVVPDAAVQFEAARALANAAGDPPYRGSSRVVDILLQAATSTGEEVVVIAHPDAVAREELATGFSRHGYACEKVATGREAILASRANVDTVLVVLAARTVRPTALETVQFIQRQATGDIPPVLVVVDPLDDDARGKFLTQLLLKFSDIDCVGIVDRLDSLFLPRVDPDTAAVLGPPRLPDHLARVAGPQAVDPVARQARSLRRRTRAARALELLADLGRRGWDVSAAETTARLALMRPPQPGEDTDLYAPAAALLGTIGSARAQQAVLRETERAELPARARSAALAAFTASVERYGPLLECQPLRAAYARYTHGSAATDRAIAAAVLAAIEAAPAPARPVPTDAAHPRPTR